MLLVVTMDDGSIWFGATDAMQMPEPRTFVNLELVRYFAAAADKKAGMSFWNI